MDTALDDSRADGIAGETGDPVDVEFRYETLTIFFDRLDADAEFRRSLIAGLAVGNQLEHLRIAGSRASDFPFEQPAAVRRLRLMIIE